MGDFSHLKDSGEAAMVDVSDKRPTARSARVRGPVQVSHACAEALTGEAVREIARTARIAAIQAAKRTSELIPLCHQVPLSGVDVDVTFDEHAARFAISANARTQSVTGVEMEAFTAATVAGLTIYDMVKAVDPEATVGPFVLDEKTGGKFGTFRRGERH